MRIPVLRGVIKRRLLVNFRAEPEVVQRILPAPFRPKLQRGKAIVGICLIRLERIRPRAFPSWLGLSSENAAHRIAVEWTAASGEAREGVFIPRRDSGSWLNRIAGGRLFPGEHHAARFRVRDDGRRVALALRSLDEAVAVSLTGEEAEALPASSVFGSLAESSAFFAKGSVGFSTTKSDDRLDGLRLHTLGWEVRALSVSEVSSSYFADPARFARGAVVFDHALIMRDLPHEWHGVDDLQVARGELGRETAASVPS